MIELHPIQSLLEDQQVRDLYGIIYTNLYNQYPAVRKMVKSAMKTDLRIKESKTSKSAIQNRFKAKGGNFWVAKNKEQSRVIGFVGVGQRQKREKDENPSIPISAVAEYEIQRLALNDQYRGMGMGKKLISTVEEFVLDLERSTSEIKLWAVTPECLVAANKLYESLGYIKEDTFQAGPLCMNIYCKSLHK